MTEERPSTPEVNGASSGLGDGVVACIDAGGSSTRLRAARAGRVIHTGWGGPANPTAVDAQTLRRSFADALQGCPPPDCLLAAVAGAGSQRTQGEIRSLLLEFFPHCDVTVVPDFVGAFWSCPRGTDACILAGTGSAVVSPSPDSTGWAVSGGRGWILGDYGSAADLGRALLAAYADDPDSWPPWVAGRVAELYGSGEWRSLVRLVQNSTSPARDLALAAPLLTELAENGSQAAVTLLEVAMNRLAVITGRHLRRYVAAKQPTVGLVGGVWTSPVARSAFLRGLAQQVPETFAVADDGIEPIDRLLRHVMGVW